MLTDQVLRGAALLDKAEPDWFLKIDLEKLDLETICYCVLGQVFRSFLKGLARLDLETGFGFGFATTKDDVEILTHLWRAVICERRSLIET